MCTTTIYIFEETFIIWAVKTHPVTKGYFKGYNEGTWKYMYNGGSNN